MSKLKVTTVNVVRKTEEQAMYSYPASTTKTANAKEIDESLINSESSNVQEFVKHKSSYQCQMFLYGLDFIINICSNEWVRNIVVVFLTVCLEVFVVMVLAASTVLTTIIVNIDDAFKHRLKSEKNVEMIEEILSHSEQETLNNYAESDKVSQEVPLTEDNDTEDSYRMDCQTTAEDVVTENITPKLIKQNKAFMVAASET